MDSVVEIPKVMNFYWDGSPMSFLHYMTFLSFYENNPDWKIDLYIPSSRYSGIKSWTTGEQSIDYVGSDYFSEVNNIPNVNIKSFDFKSIGVSDDIPETFKSDFIRWHLLSTVGGGWSDTDILYIKPISCINKNSDLVLVLSEYKHIIGFYLSKPNNPLFKYIFTKCFKTLNLQEYQSVGADVLNKFFPTIKDIEFSFPDLNYINLPMDYLYPFNHLNLKSLFTQDNSKLISENVIGIHWYNGSQIARTFNNQYTPTEKNILNTITEIIKNRYENSRFYPIKK